MKKNCKKMTAFLLAVLLLFGCVPFTSAQSENRQQAEALLAAIPDYSAITDSSSPDYITALQAAEDAVYALAELPEDEMITIPGYESAFTAYIDLLLIPVAEDIPADPVTIDDIADCILWVGNAYDRLGEVSDLIDILGEYTPFIPHPDESVTTQIHSGYYAVTVAREPIQQVSGQINQFYIDNEYTLTEEDWERIMAAYKEERNKTFVQAVNALPDTFDDTNVLEYAWKFEKMQWEFNFIDDYDTDAVMKFDRLQQEYEVAMGIYKDILIDQIQEEIDRECDVEALETYSPLKRKLVGQPIYDTIAGKIDAMILVYDNNSIVSKIENIEKLNDYEKALTPFPQAATLTGDPNGDYEINAADALLILQASVGKKDFTDAQFSASDVDGSDSLDAADALYILQYAVGDIFVFPVEMVVS